MYKVGKIVVLSDESRRLGDPDAERSVRETVANGVGAFIDGQLLTNTVTLSAGLRPAAITNGATAVTSTGSTAAQITADLNGLIAAIATGGSSLVWVMRPLTLARIAATLGANAPDLPRTLFGIPVVASANSPQQITLIDAAHILYSDSGRSISTRRKRRRFNLMTPLQIQRSQQPCFGRFGSSNLWGVKVTRWLAYLRAQTGAVSYMTGGLLMSKPRPSPPMDPGLAAIDAWRTERLAAHEEYLRTYPDRHLIEAQRKQFASVINARVAELRADYLRRHHESRQGFAIRPDRI